jgi:hypothetical protein
MLSQLTAGKRLGSCPVRSARAAVGGQGVSVDGTKVSLVVSASGATVGQNNA